MLQSVLLTTLNLMLFRAGPQDFPYEPRLTGWLVPIAVLINYFVMSLALPPIMAGAISLAVVMALSFATRVYLRMRKLDARFIQTFHALLAVSCVMTLALMVPFSEVAPELEKIAAVSDPGATDPAPAIQIPAWAALTMNLLNVWNVAVNANIFRHAGNTSIAAGLFVSFLVSIGVLMFVLFFASFVAMLIGGGSTP